MDELKHKSSNPSDYGYTYLTPRDQPPPEVGWKDKEAEDKNGVISLYSQNVLKEGETTESVDRESIANLTTTKRQWESIFTTNLNTPVDTGPKKKTAPKWEVKLPGSLRGGDRTPNAKADVSGHGVGGGQSGVDTVIVPDKNSTLAMEMVNNNNNNNNNNEKDFYDGNENNGLGIGGSGGQYESAIEYEIRMAREREEMLRTEKEERERLMTLSSSSSSSSAAATATTHKPNGTVMVLSSMEAVNGESESCQPAYNELTEADRPPGVWSLDGGMGRPEDTYQTQDVNPNESIIEREIRMQREKEAELERQRLLLASTSSPSPPSQPQPQQMQQQQQQQIQQLEEDDDVPSQDIQSPPSGRMSPAQSVSQESIIARELRELQEREEEMRRLRSAVHGVSLQTSGTPETASAPTSNAPAPSKSMSLNVTSNVQKSSLHSPTQATPNTQGTWQREVSPFVSQTRRVSHDSGSSHSVGRTSSDNTPSRSVSVQPISDGHDGSDEDSKPNFFKKQETPIEREMRLAKERENELRRMKGLPEISNKEDSFASYSADPDNKSRSEVKGKNYHAPSKQSLKKVSTTRFQKEISAQKEREHSMRNEGKVISDPEEQINLHRYREVTGSQVVDGSEKRNFVTKRISGSYNSQPAVEVQKTTNVIHQNPAGPSPSGQGVSKKSSSSGSQNFSYKEFRQTAESKIERELREMREREEELRNQRKTSVTQQTPS